MKLRKILALVLALMMLTSLAACGAKEEPAAPTENQGTAEPPKIEEPAGDEPIEIQFWYQNNATYVTAFDELAAKFNESNDKGITVVAGTKANTGGNAFRQVVDGNGHHKQKDFVKFLGIGGVLFLIGTG